MKINIKVYLSAMLLGWAVLTTSCLKTDLPQLQDSKLDSISTVNFEYRWVDTIKVGLADPQVVSHVAALDNQSVFSHDTIYCTPSFPGSFPSTQKAKVKLNRLWAYFTIPDAAVVTPIDNAPKLGTPGDFSHPVSYKVTAASGASRIYVVVVASLPIVNKYEGSYTVTGTVVDKHLSTITGRFPWNVYLNTTGPTQVTVTDLDVTGAYYHAILNGSDDSYYGGFGVVFNFDSNNNVTSVVNYYGQPSSNGRSAELDPSGINKWDPATKVLKVKYWMNQTGLNDANGHRTYFDETFTLK
jgi:hypothetical protein